MDICGKPIQSPRGWKRKCMAIQKRTRLLVVEGCQLEMLEIGDLIDLFAGIYILIHDVMRQSRIALESEHQSLRKHSMKTGWCFHGFQLLKKHQRTMNSTSGRACGVQTQLKRVCRSMIFPFSHICALRVGVLCDVAYLPRRLARVNYGHCFSDSKVPLFHRLILVFLNM